MSGRVLVAGVGNIFLSDDGFGPEVVRQLAAEPFPEWVRLKDFGISGIHLAYELGAGYDTAILIDAAPRGGPPGTVYLIEHDQGGEAPPPREQVSLLDAHGMEPVAVLALLETLGGTVDRVLVVGCEPATIEDGIGLSEPVTAAVDEAVRVVRELVATLAPQPALEMIGKR